MTELIAILNKIVPVHYQQATTPTSVPYAVYDISETPIRTKDGIAGYEGTLTLSVFAQSVARARELAKSIISTIDAQRIGNRRYYYADASDEDYPDEGITSTVLTFNTIQ